MFGIDDLAIAAMIASAAMQAKAQGDAQKRQRQQAVEAQRRALGAQNQATDVALKRVEEFNPENRTQKTQELATGLEDQYNTVTSAPAITAQGVQVGQTIEGGGTDYLAAKARETAKTTASMRSLASLMGRIGGAQELRRGEAIGIGDTAGEIGRIGTGANNMAGIDQIGIQAAGQPSIGMTLASSALGAYGMGRMASAGLAAGGGTVAGTGINPAAASGLGVKPGLDMGLGIRGGASWLRPY